LNKRELCFVTSLYNVVLKVTTLPSPQTFAQNVFEYFSLKTAPFALFRNPVEMRK
jgi:hypothetical protein